MGSPLNLHLLIPQKDVRKLIWRLLDPIDREMIKCAHNRNRRPYISMTKCAEKGYINLLKLGITYGYSSHSICDIAARGGHLEVFKWALENGCHRNQWTCAEAALGGHLELLQWARANGCPWNYSVCENAAQGGHLNVLKWARANGGPWGSSTCTWAAKNGHLEMLKWARDNGCPWDKRTCLSVAKKGLLQWIQENE
jgi:hypothetical protein